MKNRFKICVAVYIVILRDSKVLLLRRQNTGWHDGNWGLPAGHLEDGEFSTDAAIREAKEEMGIQISKTDLQLFHVQHRRREKKDDNDYIDLFFIAKKWDGIEKNNEPEKCSEIKWFDLGGLPKNVIPNVLRAIQSMNSKNGYSEILE